MQQSSIFLGECNYLFFSQLKRLFGEPFLSCYHKLRHDLHEFIGTHHLPARRHLLREDGLF